MTVHSTVYCVLVIITTFYSFGDTERKIQIMMYYNRVSRTGCIKEEKGDGVCYYKDGDVLNANCFREKYYKHNTLRMYQCKHGKFMSGIDIDKNLDKCGATASLNQNNVNTYLNLSKEDDKSTILCEFSNGFQRSNRSPTKLVFQPDEPPTIIINDMNFNKSLSKPNIYEGKIGEKFKIVCRSNEKSGTLQWEYCKDLSKEPPCLTQKNNGTEIMYAIIELTQKLNGTEIKCVYNNENQKNTTTSVMFNLQPDSKAIANGNYNEDIENDKEFIGSLFFWVTVGVGTLIIIILIIITLNLYGCRKSGKNMGEEEITYENLSSEIPIPPTFPNSAKLEEIYLKPSDCQEPNSRMNDNDAYTLPHVETNIEYLYSKPIPKSQRNSKPQHLEKTTKNIKTNEPSYAEIETFTNNDSVRRDNTEYATANFNPNYTNVFVNETYVNAKADVENDYAEPTYCEIGMSVGKIK